MPSSWPTIEWVNEIGQLKPNYERLWAFQKNRVDAIAAGDAPESVLLCEHELIATLGRRAKSDNLVDSSLPHLSIERGGDITLHSPGQLVIYPMLKLHGEIFPRGLHEYLRFCEEVVIQTLFKFGIEAGRWGPTGIWVKVKGETKKIGSIGVAVRRWITYHGISLNISNDLKEFSRIRPCDFDSSVMTSMKAVGVEIDLQSVASEFQTQFTKALKDVAAAPSLLKAAAEDLHHLPEVAVEG